MLLYISLKNVLALCSYFYYIIKLWLTKFFKFILGAIKEPSQFCIDIHTQYANIN